MKSRLGAKMEQAIESAAFYKITPTDIHRTHALFLLEDDTLWASKLLELTKVNFHLYNTLLEQLKLASIGYELFGGDVYTSGIEVRECTHFWRLLVLVMLPLYFACDAKWPMVSRQTVEFESSGLLEQYAGNPTGLQSDFMRELLHAQGEEQQSILKDHIRESEFHPAQLIFLEWAAYLFLRVFPCRFSI